MASVYPAGRNFKLNCGKGILDFLYALIFLFVVFGFSKVSFLVQKA